jgi:hypothetical protein
MMRYEMMSKKVRNAYEILVRKPQGKRPNCKLHTFYVGNSETTSVSYG